MNISQINPITPMGTNSTMFTECCLVAINDDQPNCPHCGKPVIGYDLPLGERRKARWMNATRYWNRKAMGLISEAQ